jgi:hypothetical protein
MNESLDLKLAINGRLFGANKKKKDLKIIN